MAQACSRSFQTAVWVLLSVVSSVSGVLSSATEVGVDVGIPLSQGLATKLVLTPDPGSALFRKLSQASCEDGNPCGRAATCTVDTSSNFLCSCSTGYEGDGFHCSPVTPTKRGSLVIKAESFDAPQIRLDVCLQSGGEEDHLMARMCRESLDSSGQWTYLPQFGGKIVQVEKSGVSLRCLSVIESVMSVVAKGCNDASRGSQPETWTFVDGKLGFGESGQAPRLFLRVDFVSAGMSHSFQIRMTGHKSGATGVTFLEDSKEVERVVASDVSPEWLARLMAASPSSACGEGRTCGTFAGCKDGNCVCLYGFDGDGEECLPSDPLVTGWVFLEHPSISKATDSLCLVGMVGDERPPVHTQAEEHTTATFLDLCLRTPTRTNLWNYNPFTGALFVLGADDAPYCLEVDVGRGVGEGDEYGLRLHKCRREGLKRPHRRWVLTERHVMSVMEVNGKKYYMRVTGDPSVGRTLTVGPGEEAASSIHFFPWSHPGTPRARVLVGNTPPISPNNFPKGTYNTPRTADLVAFLTYLNGMFDVDPPPSPSLSRPPPPSNQVVKSPPSPLPPSGAGLQFPPGGLAILLPPFFNPLPDSIPSGIAVVTDVVSKTANIDATVDIEASYNASYIPDTPSPLPSPDELIYLMQEGLHANGSEGPAPQPGRRRLLVGPGGNLPTTPLCTTGAWVQKVLIPIGNCNAAPQGAGLTKFKNQQYIEMYQGRPVGGCRRQYGFKLPNLSGGVRLGVMILRICSKGKPSVKTCGYESQIRKVPYCGL